MDLNFHYVSNRTLDKDVKTNIINPDILHNYQIIKKKKNYWGIFLRHKNEIIGTTLVAYQNKDYTDFLLLASVFIDEKYRGRNLCKDIVKQTILKNQKLNKTHLIKVVIAGGMPILKCIICVFKELNYTIKKYKTKDENTQILQTILPKTAIKFELSNYDNDIWQTLFFDKK